MSIETIENNRAPRPRDPSKMHERIQGASDTAQRLFHDASDTIWSLGAKPYAFGVGKVKSLYDAIATLHDARQFAELDPTTTSLPLRIETLAAFAPVISRSKRLRDEAGDERFINAASELLIAPVQEQLHAIGDDLISRYDQAAESGYRVACQEYEAFGHELTLMMLMLDFGDPRKVCTPDRPKKHNVTRKRADVIAHNFSDGSTPKTVAIDGPDTRNQHDVMLLSSGEDLYNTVDSPLWEGFYSAGTHMPTLRTLLKNDGSDKAIKSIILTEIAQDLKKKLF